MLIAQLSEVFKSFGSQELLEDVHWQIREGDRISLVGRNGAGKTTLFRILAGEVDPDRGSVWRRRGAVIASMEQEVRVDDRRTLREEAARGLQHLQDLQQEHAEATLALTTLQEGDAEAESLLEHYARLQERLEREGGYSFDARIKEVLEGLHFSEADLDRPLVEFSGGQKSRAMLARVLLRDPDLLLLDEPTNHLDLDAIEWLEHFLQEYQGAYVIVSHDRMFLNRLAREVVELRYRKLHRFQGNYDAFLVERERRLEEQARRYELQQTEIKRQEDFVRRNIAGGNTKQAQARRRMLEKLERFDAPEWPASSIHMRLPEPTRCARNVVEAKRLGKRYGDLRVFSNVEFLLLRGQKIGLIGPNGVGKTTLVRLIIGEESQDEGKLRIGPGVEMGYYEQEQTHIRGSQSVLDEVWSLTPQVTENEVRAFLGSFLFRGEDVFKPLNFLSGGEKSRVALAKLVRQGANFLLLDEPTNHLDIESREVFEAALQAYAGTVLVVSHDRYFLDRVMDHVLELHADGCRLWEGGYSRYAAERRAVLAEAPPAPPRGGDDPAVLADRNADKEERRFGYEEQRQRKRDEEKLRRRLRDAEAEVGRLDALRQEILMEMEDPGLATEAARLADLQARLEAAQREASAAISEWERLAMRLEAFLDGDN